MNENVVSFEPKKKQKDLVKTIEETIHGLNRMEDTIIKAYTQVDFMESQYDNVHRIFEKLLVQYADEYGAENIPEKYLEYTRNVEIAEDSNGEITLIWKKPE